MYTDYDKLSCYASNCVVHTHMTVKYLLQKLQYAFIPEIYAYKLNLVGADNNLKGCILTTI